MSYPVFSPILTSQLVTNDSWRKIRTKETWAASSLPGVLFRKIRQAYFSLGLCQPCAQLDSLMSRKQSAGWLSVPFEPEAAHSNADNNPQDHQSQAKPCWKFLRRTAPLSLLPSPSEHLSLSSSPSATWGS